MSVQTNPELEVLKEILKWTRFSGIKQVKATLEEVLDSDQKRLAYQLSDRTRTTREVAALATGGGKTTIENWWKYWYRLGLGETVSVRGGDRFMRSFDLTDFGISFPKQKFSPKPDKPDDGEVDKTD